MMSVLEFAKEYNVTTFQVLKICKRLNINVSSENDMLSEKDVANIKDKVNYYEVKKIKGRENGIEIEIM